MKSEISKIELEFYELTVKLKKLKAQNDGNEVKNYSFQNLNGPVSLLDLFAGQDRLD